MKQKIIKIWDWFYKIAGQYLKTIVFISSISTAAWWGFGPRIMIEVNGAFDSILTPKLEKRDSIRDIQRNVEIYTMFLKALTDTTFLNKVEVIIETTTDKVVDKKLTGVMRREMVLKIKEMVKDTVWIINANTGNEIGYDVYHFYNGGVIKVAEKRF